MLTAHHLSKTYDSQTIFENVTFSLNPGDRVGMVGPNGCGKTTLLRILTGLEAPTSGHVSRDADLRIGYLPQGFEPDPNLTLGELLAQQTGGGRDFFTELENAAAQLARYPLDPDLQQRYDALVELVSSDVQGRTAQVLGGLGLDAIDPDLPVHSLSGGQQTRLSLALVLLGDPELLLLDEPTNHLDIAMLEWLETWLAQCHAAVLIVSHDRLFLDHTVDRILEMDPLRDGSPTVHEYAGNYSAYIEKRQAEIEKQWNTYKDQQSEIQRMRADVARTKSQAAFTERQASSIRIGGPDFKIKGYKSYQQGIAKKVAAKAKARETRLERFLESDEIVDRPQRAWQQASRQMRLEFDHETHISRSVLTTHDLSIGYTQNTPLLQNLNLHVQGGQRIAITGPNGSGKTTLLRTLAGQLPPLAGSVQPGASARLGYMSQDQSILDPQRSAVDHIADYLPNETRARTFLALYLFTGDEPLKKSSQLSYGQRARLMLALLVAQGCNLLLLDEPINHLDIPSRAQFEAALAAFDGTVLAVVHDRYFIERFAREIWWIQDGQCSQENMVV